VEGQTEDLYYLEDVMVASSGSGYKSAGEKVDVVDIADSMAWLKALHKVGTYEECQKMGLFPDVIDEAVPEVTEDSPEVVDETTVNGDAEVIADAAVLIAKAKEVLAKGKKRLNDLATECESTEAALKPVLTKENGFLLNQQGWYSVQVTNSAAQ
jgi:predicted nucleic acid-binding Zn ribbon protein